MTADFRLSTFLGAIIFVPQPCKLNKTGAEATFRVALGISCRRLRKHQWKAFASWLSAAWTPFNSLRSCKQTELAPINLQAMKALGMC